MPSLSHSHIYLLHNPPPAPRFAVFPAPLDPLWASVLPVSVLVGEGSDLASSGLDPVPLWQDLSSPWPNLETACDLRLRAEAQRRGGWIPISSSTATSACEMNEPLLPEFSVGSHGCCVTSVSGMGCVGHVDA